MKPPPASSLNALRTMRSTRSVSRREVEFRRIVWSLGVRGYRVGPNLPGKPDMYFPGVRLAVFFHGCYWHRCPECDLALPRQNREFWASKFAANAERDARVIELLSVMGIHTETIWEHEAKDNPQDRARQLKARIQTIRNGGAHS